MNTAIRKPFFKIKLEDTGKQIPIQINNSLSTITIIESMVGFTIGQFYCTKRTGPSIHVKKNKKSKKK